MRNQTHFPGEVGSTRLFSGSVLLWFLLPFSAFFAALLMSALHADKLDDRFLATEETSQKNLSYLPTVRIFFCLAQCVGVPFIEVYSL